MVGITEQTRPICAKCKTNPALSYMDGIWVCGQCLHEYLQLKEKQRREAFLEG